MSTSTPSREHTQTEAAPAYPALSSSAMERIAGYIGPGLRKRMATRRSSELDLAELTRSPQ